MLLGFAMGNDHSSPGAPSRVDAAPDAPTPDSKPPQHTPSSVTPEAPEPEPAPAATTTQSAERHKILGAEMNRAKKLCSEFGLSIGAPCVCKRCKAAWRISDNYGLPGLKRAHIPNYFVAMAIAAHNDTATYAAAVRVSETSQTSVTSCFRVWSLLALEREVRTTTDSKAASFGPKPNQVTCRAFMERTGDASQNGHDLKDAAETFMERLLDRWCDAVSGEVAQLIYELHAGEAGTVDFDLSDTLQTVYYHETTEPDFIGHGVSDDAAEHYATVRTTGTRTRSPAWSFEWVLIMLWKARVLLFILERFTDVAHTKLALPHNGWKPRFTALISNLNAFVINALRCLRAYHKKVITHYVDTTLRHVADSWVAARIGENFDESFIRRLHNMSSAWFKRQVAFFDAWEPFVGRAASKEGFITNTLINPLRLEIVIGHALREVLNKISANNTVAVCEVVRMCGKLTRALKDKPLIETVQPEVIERKCQEWVGSEVMRWITRTRSVWRHLEPTARIGLIMSLAKIVNDKNGRVLVDEHTRGHLQGIVLEDARSFFKSVETKALAIIKEEMMSRLLETRAFQLMKKEGKQKKKSQSGSSNSPTVDEDTIIVEGLMKRLWGPDQKDVEANVDWALAKPGVVFCFEGLDPMENADAVDWAWMERFIARIQTQRGGAIANVAKKLVVLKMKRTRVEAAAAGTTNGKSLLTEAYEFKGFDYDFNTLSEGFVTPVMTLVASPEAATEQRRRFGLNRATLRLINWLAEYVFIIDARRSFQGLVSFHSVLRHCDNILSAWMAQMSEIVLAYQTALATKSSYTIHAYMSKETVLQRVKVESSLITILHCLSAVDIMIDRLVALLSLDDVDAVPELVDTFGARHKSNLIGMRAQILDTSAAEVERLMLQTTPYLGFEHESNNGFSDTAAHNDSVGNESGDRGQVKAAVARRAPFGVSLQPLFEEFLHASPDAKEERSDGSESSDDSGPGFLDVIFSFGRPAAPTTRCYRDIYCAAMIAIIAALDFDPVTQKLLWGTLLSGLNGNQGFMADRRRVILGCIMKLDEDDDGHQRPQQSSTEAKGKLEETNHKVRSKLSSSSSSSHTTST